MFDPNETPVRTPEPPLWWSYLAFLLLVAISLVAVTSAVLALSPADPYLHPALGGPIVMALLGGVFAFGNWYFERPGR